MPRLTARFGGEPILHRTILTVGEGETILAERIADIEDALPPHIRLAYLPNLGQVRLRLTGSGANEQQLANELDSWKNRLTDRLGDLVFGGGSQRLEEVVGDMLKEAGLRVATAESCTGGYLAHLLTSVPGSSAYFMGSIVAYGNAVKMNLLGVPYEEIHAHGAVSEQVVKAMAEGARQQLAVDIALAVSGIAGPEGGTPDKPVGTVWLAISTARETRAKKLLLGKDRIKNIQLASVYALDLIRKSILRLSNKEI
jgi:nicotinamide-nucleotide amidase